VGGSQGEGDSVVDYLVGVVILAVVLIVALAAVGSELASILNRG
jgi:hypothetical protein